MTDTADIPLLKTFPQLLGSSAKTAARLFGRLLGIQVFLFLRLLAYILACAAVTALAELLLERQPRFHLAAYAMDILAVGYAAYAVLRWNGAAAYAYAAVSQEDPAVRSRPAFRKAIGTAKDSWHNGLRFFWNAFQTGTVIILGQTLAVCPCFLVQSNFVFSPNLYVYENITGDAARRRSRELTAGFGWLVLRRSAGYLLIGYVVLVLLLLAILSPHPSEFVALALVFALFAGMLQSVFVHEIYEESKRLHETGAKMPSGSATVAATAAGVLVIGVVYYGVKFALLLLERRGGVL